MRQRLGVAVTNGEVRAFLAVPVTPPALDDGVRLLDRLRGALPEVRWVRSEGLHLTLHFFESLHEHRVDAVVDAARTAAAHHAPYTAQLAGLGCFPRDGDERVLWIGMTQGAEETARLQRDAEGALDAAGFAPEPRGFKPHVTLGRPRQRFSDAQRQRWREHAAESLSAFHVGGLRLYRSHPGPGGSRYEVLAALPLSAAP